MIGYLADVGGLIVGGLLFAAAIALWLLGRGREAEATTESEQGWEAIELELSRSRRMERTFSLARATLVAHPTTAARSSLLATMRGSTRDIDACWWSGRHLLILLSETPRWGAMGLVRRLQRELPHAAVWTIAEYPVDGLTLEALLASLEDRSRSVAQLEVSDGAV